MSKKSESNAEAADLFLTEKKHAQCCVFKLRLKVLELEVWWSTFFHHFTRANVIKAVKWFSVTQILCAQAGYNCHSDEEIKKLVQWLKTRKTEIPSAGRPSTNTQSTTPPERRDRKKGKFPIAWTITHRASLSDQIIRAAGANSSLAQPTDHSKVLSGWFQLFGGFFLAPTTSLWGLMGNKIKNIKNLEAVKFINTICRLYCIYEFYCCKQNIILLIEKNYIFI